MRSWSVSAMAADLPVNRAVEPVRERRPDSQKVVLRHNLDGSARGQPRQTCGAGQGRALLRRLVDTQLGKRGCREHLDAVAHEPEARFVGVAGVEEHRPEEEDDAELEALQRAV